jgi:ABC-type branched-subunit amino acid transport system ATPase component
MPQPILSTRALTKSFGNLLALDSVSIDIEERRVSILVGPNGSGKTTLINVISGLYKPDAGKVIYQSKDVSGLPPYKLYSMGLARTFQIPALFWKLTVLENLLVAERGNPGESFWKAFDIVGLKSTKNFFRPWRDTSSGWLLITTFTALRSELRTRKLTKKTLDPRRIASFSTSFLRVMSKPWIDFFTPAWQDHEKRATEKAARILRLLGLSRLWNQPAYLLSGGQMKLVEIGRALMTDAKLILLDEPVSGVNPTLAHEIFARILKLRDELGLTFFIVEHRLDIALKYVDHMFAMALGRVVASGPPDEVLNNRKVIESYLGG